MWIRTDGFSNAGPPAAALAGAKLAGVVVLPSGITISARARKAFAEGRTAAPSGSGA
jgi:hypothetical protein